MFSSFLSQNMIYWANRVAHKMGDYTVSVVPKEWANDSEVCFNDFDERHCAKVKYTYSPSPLLQLTAVTDFIFVTWISLHFPLPGFHFPRSGILPSSPVSPHCCQRSHAHPQLPVQLHHLWAPVVMVAWELWRLCFPLWGFFCSFLMSAVRHSQLIDNSDALWLIFESNETLFTSLVTFHLTQYLTQDWQATRCRELLFSLWSVEVEAPRVGWSTFLQATCCCPLQHYPHPSTDGGSFRQFTFTYLGLLKSLRLFDMYGQILLGYF